MTFDDFSYENLLVKNYALDKNNNIEASYVPINGEFFLLNYHDKSLITQPDMPRHGWKLAISVDDTEKDVMNSNNVAYSSNLAKAWNITKDILLKNGIRKMKVIHPNSTPLREQFGKLLDADGREQLVKGIEAGKQIVVYVSTHPEKSAVDWQVIMTEITELFLTNGIKPDVLPLHGSNYFANNKYFSYRNDATRHGRYQPVSDSYNPHQYEDIFESIHFEKENVTLDEAKILKKRDKSKCFADISSVDDGYEGTFFEEETEVHIAVGSEISDNVGIDDENEETKNNCRCMIL